QTANGNVEAKVVCFYRRRDIPSNLIALADKHSKELEEEIEGESLQQLTEKQIHQLRHRELFLSRQLESLPATHIRGKCCVTLLNETEALFSYLDKEDSFFYCLVYDPQQKTLLADKGEIRIGPRFQADITDLMKEDETDDRDQTELETKIWEPESPLTDEQIDQFLVIARSVGTFARALDCSSSIRQPSLHMSAAAASRDITLFHAMDTLHRCSYDMSCAITALVPQGGPVLCRDEMEEWSASEANLFEEALEKYGKDFVDIRQDFLPWKSLTSIVEYYYMWKTTDRYVQQSPFGYWVKNANPKYTLKTKQAFYLQTTTLTKIARQLCLALLQPRRAARRPFVPVNSAEIKAQCLPNHSQVRQLASLNKSYLLNGKSYEKPQRMMKHGSLPPLKDRRMNWIDAPDDVFFMANEDTRKVRKLLASFDVKRAARQPYKQIFIKHIESELDVPAQLRHPVNEEPIIIED
ncbi:Metastasis-associated protein MTA3, partial [Acipenser ruthenus]